MLHSLATRRAYLLLHSEPSPAIAFALLPKASFHFRRPAITATLRQTYLFPPPNAYIFNTPALPPQSPTNLLHITFTPALRPSTSSQSVPALLLRLSRPSLLLLRPTSPDILSSFLSHRLSLDMALVPVAFSPLFTPSPSSSSFARPFRRTSSSTTPNPHRHDALRCPMSSQSPPETPRPNHSLANLHELTERIADLLQVGSLHKTHPHCPKDAPLGYLSATTHVAVVFGRHLIRDQITIEYAKRIVTLVKQIASGALNPDVICFTGGKGLAEHGSISEAVAGYSFFRTVCEEANVDVGRFDFILEEESHNTKENLHNVIEELRRRLGADAVNSCHFTLVSSDYHLIRIQEVHRLSPRQSVLFPLEVSSSTWNCIFAAYPFCVSRDPTTAFLGRAVVLANDLAIVLVNLNGALDDREFVARENLHRLNETFAKMREMYRVIDSRTSSIGSFRTDMRSHAESLELAIHNVREVQTLLNPLNEIGASVPKSHLQMSRDLLTTTIAKMRTSMDPDRVLRVHDRMAILDGLAAFVEDQQTKIGDSVTSSEPNEDPDHDESDLLVSDASDPTLFASSDDFDYTSRRPVRKTTRMLSEISWQGGTPFKGNGKKITRDGPNLVIIDSNASAVPPPTSTPRRTRRRQAAPDAKSLTPISLTPTKSARQPSSRTSSQGSRTRASTTRKSRATTTTTPRKRKSAPRKVASKSTSEKA